MGSPMDSTKHLNKELYQFSTISIMKLITLIPKPDKDIIRKLRPISVMNTGVKISSTKYY